MDRQTDYAALADPELIQYRENGKRGTKRGIHHLNETYSYNQDLDLEKTKLKIISQQTWNFFMTDAKKFGFEDRIGQQNMALDIVDAIMDDQHIAVEAGVGIGKSYAYIVPLMLYNRYMCRPVAIATSTITLQEQLEKDIRTISDLIHYHPQVVLAKGQTNFICKKRANEYLYGKKQHLHVEIRREMETGISDRKDFKLNIDTLTWNQINIKDFNISTCSDCPFRTDCYFLSLRTQMKNTNGIIVCNQDLLTAHLRKIRRSQKPLLNESISLIVVDEAHNLEGKVRSSLTVSFAKTEIINKVQTARKTIRAQGTSLDTYMEQLPLYLDILYSRFEAQVNNQIRANPNEIKDVVRFSIDFTNDLHLDLINVAKIISEIYNEIEILYGGSHSDFSEYAVEALENIAEFFHKLATDLDSEIYWLERYSNKIYLCSCPHNIAKVIRQLYFDRESSTIMTSATIANSTYGDNKEKYSYFIANTAFPVDNRRGFLSDPLPSPFPYDDHTMLYYCDDLPHPTKERHEFIVAGISRLVELLKISSGRALVLFTAKADMEDVYESLAHSELPYEILMQREDASQDAVLNTFRKNVSSVLLGTGAYWEGINIEGESLSNLIVFRLPFPVPDPIIEYKRSIAKDPLMDVNVPEMIIKLKQGIGRLIRNYNDKGIVSVIDPRMGDSSTAPYKDLVWDSIPIHRRTNSLIEIKRFYDTVVMKQHI